MKTARYVRSDDGILLAPPTRLFSAAEDMDTISKVYVDGIDVTDSCVEVYGAAEPCVSTMGWVKRLIKAREGVPLFYLPDVKGDPRLKQICGFVQWE